MSKYLQWSADRALEFKSKGSRARRYFAHGAYRLARGGPDGLKTARRLLGDVRADQLRQIILYASPEAVRDLPQELFFDRNVQWHEQHCGQARQVAWANLVLQDGRLVVTALQSDLVQRIGRIPELRSRVDNRFRAWPHLLWNAVADYALELGLSGFCAPTSRHVIENAVPKERKVGASLFERTYDHALLERFAAEQSGGWWRVDLNRNRTRVVVSEKVCRPSEPRRRIAIFHDIERGWGHRTDDPVFAERAEASSPRALSAILAVERRCKVRATYNVVGAFLPEVEEEIRADGQAVAFHSFDHGAPTEEQLWRCRSVDYRIKGYRTPQSKFGDLTPGVLSYYNFEWLASSAWSLGFAEPCLDSGVVIEPVHMDDFALHTREASYTDWEKLVLSKALRHDYFAIGLHDCYAEHWLSRYESLLEKLAALGEFATLDQVAWDAYLDAAV